MLKQLRQTDSYFWSASIDKLVLSWPTFTATPPWTFDPTFMERNVYGANRLWANCPWGEMSSVWRNVHGTKRPYTGRNVYEANCPFGEKSINPHGHWTRGCSQQAHLRPQSTTPGLHPVSIDQTAPPRAR